MQLFYAPDITLPLYELPEEESRHCVKVLRMTRGSALYLTDGRGNLYRAELADVSAAKCTARIVETVPEFEKRGYSLTMAVAPTKNIDRFEWFLEKATETGVDRIIPIECDHSERRVIKPGRQEKVITSAVKQSLKAYHPRLDDITPVKEIMEAPFEGRKLIAHCREDFPRVFIGDAVGKGGETLILIGPEGDFSKEEIELAYKNGFTGVSLGTSRLRTETAALAAVTVAAFINN